MTDSAKMAELLELFANLNKRQQSRVTDAVRSLLFSSLEQVYEIVRGESIRGGYKKCSTCGEEGPLALNFYRDGSKPDGHMYDCIACTLEKREAKRGMKAA